MPENIKQNGISQDTDQDAIRIKLSILEKSCQDSYTYFAFIRNFGWIKFQYANKTSDPLKVCLEGAEFFSAVPDTFIKLSAEQRGIDVFINDIVLLLDCAS